MYTVCEGIRTNVSVKLLLHGIVPTGVYLTYLEHGNGTVVVVLWRASKETPTVK